MLGDAMLDSTIPLLAATAAFIGVTHTLLGPDHYVPFIAMARCGRWSLRRTLVITTICGLGHVLSSVVLGLIGVAIGTTIGVQRIEGVRGELAGWLLLGFGLAYMVWGVRRAARHRTHSHWHAHADGTVHSHLHQHEGAHAHVHEADTQARDHEHAAEAELPNAARLTPWILFTIFVLGPCEPLIPLLMVPAASHSVTGLVLVTSVFLICTIATMHTVVTAGYLGVNWLPLGKLERYTHALAGGALVACGCAIQLGL